MSKKILAFILVMLFSVASVGVAASKTNGALRVGSDITYPPFEFADEVTNEYKGFDMELIRALGQIMGRKVEIVNVGWDGIIPGLINGNYDVLISAMTITPERAQAVNFSDPYFVTGQVIVTRANDKMSYKSAKDLKGKVVSVQIGTTGDFEATDNKSVKKVSRFNTTPEALQELLNGAADASVVDELVAKEFIAQNPGKVKMSKIFTTENYGIAIKKGNKTLLKEVNQALAKFKASGEYDKLYKKWFGTAPNK